MTGIGALESGIRGRETGGRKHASVLGTAPSTRGFTLIEMLISMALAMILLAGMGMLFTRNTRLATAEADRTARMGDLYLASMIIQQEIRTSRKLTNPPYPSDLTARGVSLPANYPASFSSLPYWDANSKTLTYQDMDGNTGIFQYQRSAGDRIYWLRADAGTGTFQELIRDLDTTSGMTTTVSPAGVWSIKLTASYKNNTGLQQTMSLAFKVWPRN